MKKQGLRCIFIFVHARLMAPSHRVRSTRLWKLLQTMFWDKIFFEYFENKSIFCPLVRETGQNLSQNLEASVFVVSWTRSYSKNGHFGPDKSDTHGQTQRSAWAWRKTIEADWTKLSTVFFFLLDTFLGPWKLLNSTFENFFNARPSINLKIFTWIFTLFH